MPLFTLICRLSDKTLVVESMDTEESNQYEVYRTKGRRLIQTLGVNTEPSGVFGCGEDYYFLYITENNMFYMTFCDKSYPRKLAYKFLEELKDEFMIRHGEEVKQKKLRPYAFQKFGT
jgi:vesicle transport protein SEC22